MKNNKLIPLFLAAIWAVIIFTEALCCNLKIIYVVPYIVFALTTILINVKLRKTDETKTIIFLDVIFIIGVFAFDPMMLSLSQIIAYLFYRKKEIKWNLKNLLLTFLIPMVIGELLQRGYINLVANIFGGGIFSIRNYEVAFFGIVLVSIIVFNTIVLISYKLILDDNMQFSKKVTIAFKVSFAILICIISLKLYNNLSSAYNANKCFKVMKNAYYQNTIIQDADYIRFTMYPQNGNQETLDGYTENSEYLYDFNNITDASGTFCKEGVESLLDSYEDLYNKAKGATKKARIQEEAQAPFKIYLDIYEAYAITQNVQLKSTCAIYVIQSAYIVLIYVITKKQKTSIEE